MVTWLRALTFKHWISHRCGNSLVCGICEMPSSALVSQGPVVQSIVSLTSSLRGQLVKCFATL